MAGKLIRYTFAVCYAGCEECEYITYGIPEDVDDPQIYFENKTGEADPEKLDELLMMRDEKLEGLALWVKDLKAEADAIRAEEKALAERRQAKERKAESIKAYLEKVLARQKFETSRAVCSFRKSQKVEITDLDKIPDDYLRYSTPTADKTAIKAAIKDGISIEGAELVDSISMTIK